MNNAYFPLAQGGNIPENYCIPQYPNCYLGMPVYKHNSPRNTNNDRNIDYKILANEIVQNIYNLPMNKKTEYLIKSMTNNENRYHDNKCSNKGYTDLISSIIEVSSIEAFPHISECNQVINYLRNKEATPRRILAFNNVLSCNCENSVYLKLMRDSHEFIQYFKFANVFEMTEPIDFDLVDKLDYNDYTINKTIKRIDYIKLKHPILWHMGLDKKYAMYFEKIFKYYSKSTINKDIIIKIAKFWERQDIIKSIADGILDSKFISQNIDPKLLRYYIGLYHQYTTSIDDTAMIKVNIGIMLNNEIKLQQHLNFVVRTNELELNMLIKLTEEKLKTKVIVVNTEDSGFDEINNYQPCDIARYQDSGKIYQFTVPEFDWLIKSRKNMFTGLPLSDDFIDELIKKKANHPCIRDADIVKNLIPKLIGKRISINELIK
jgi:hypothetical protein